MSGCCSSGVSEENGFHIGGKRKDKHELVLECLVSGCVAVVAIQRRQCLSCVYPSASPDHRHTRASTLLPELDA